MKYLSENNLEELKNIIDSHAKYQKVMLLYDDTVSNAEIMEIYNTLKGLCVYNHAHISQYDPLELNNGYRALIIKANADSVLSLNIDYNEFVTVFIPTDRMILPYVLTHDDKINLNDNAVIQTKNNVDINAWSSIYFNQFLNYLHSLFTLNENSFLLLGDDDVNTNILSKLETLPEDLEFFDIKILKNIGIEYKYLCLIDIIVINAFLVMISSIRNKSLVLVDTYKASGQNCVLIDKFFAMAYDKTFIDIINLNYHSLYNFCDKIKSKILPLIDMSDIDITMIEQVIAKIKDYTKNTDDKLLSYLYLYNVFGV